MLHLVVHKEETPGQAGMEGFQNLWEYEKQHAIKDCHFLVLHLSYIERILAEKYASHPASPKAADSAFLRAGTAARAHRPGNGQDPEQSQPP